MYNCMVELRIYDPEYLVKGHVALGFCSLHSHCCMSCCGRFVKTLGFSKDLQWVAIDSRHPYRFIYIFK